MKLLILTQKVDKLDPILGFFHRWIEEFAVRAERVTVICLNEGVHQLPKNVTVLSLGKSNGQQVVFKDRVRFIFAFYSYIWGQRKNYDTVFVHMNPIYVVFGGLFWKVLGKKVSMWYTHRSVDLKLRIAEVCADIIFTAAKESFTLPSNKVVVTGHGIDVSQFLNMQRSKVIGTEPIRLLHVGRITQIKNCGTLIEAAKILRDSWNKKFEIVFAGSPVTDADRSYMASLSSMITNYALDEMVHFIGHVAPADISKQYAACDATVNLTPTGGIDKAVLESMASGVPVFSSNQAFVNYFDRYADKLIFKEKNASDLAQKIIAVFEKDMSAVGSDLQKIAKEKADIGVLISKLVEELSK
ncbi:MAG TPA: glycosyltransferase family 4 protein [Candidatus Paceibacterota bacterium]|jgi:glycosyltransferase involved in cell wall biosynthesis|nr:glycosyltransferase family 4 protein [Candidatus Paceibacterota bacterium]